MENGSRYINDKQIGPYIQKCLSQMKGKDTKWLGKEVFYRVNPGEAMDPAAQAKWNQKAKQWIAGDHQPSVDVLFALSEIFGKSIYELMAGQDLPKDETFRLTLYSVARSNNPALYQQLCSAELEAQTDEYGKTLLNYVLEFQADKILLAMLNNPTNPVELFGSYAVDPGSTNAIPMGEFLSTAAKNQDIFEKLYSPEIPWSFSEPKEKDAASMAIQPIPEGVDFLLKQKWARNLLLKENEQKRFEWIDKVNHCHVMGPYSTLPYLCGAFNCALESSLRSGDTSFAEFGIAHNKVLAANLASAKIPFNELGIDAYGRLTDRGRPVSTLAWLSPATVESLKEKKGITSTLSLLLASFGGFGR